MTLMCKFTYQKITYLIPCLFIFIQSGLVHAAGMPLPTYLDSVQLEQKNRLALEEEQRENVANQSQWMLENTPPPADNNALCFPIQQIEFIGASSLLSTKIQSLISPYQQQCLSLTTINRITKSITNAYIQQGYVTSQAFIPEQDLSSQQLRIQIIEGRIELITIENSPPRLVNMVFPALQGEVLNLRDIEQGLEQLNRLSSAKYSIDIQPGKQTGYSRIAIKKAAKRFPINGQIVFDNFGKKFAGKTEVTGSLTVDSPLGLGEQWSLTANTDTDFSTSHYHRYVLGAVNIPYGYWSYRYQIYQNHNLKPFSQGWGKYPYRAKTQNQQVTVSRLVYRDGQQRLILQGGVKHKKLQTQLAQQTLLISSPTLTAVSLSAQYSTALGKGYFTFNPHIELGLSALGASADYIAENSPRSHYRKAVISSSYQYYFPNGMTFLTSLYGQYTPDNLYATEQLTIGGQYSVRGYHLQSLNSNRGGYWRNELQKNIADISIGQIRATAAIDYGYLVADNYQNEANSLMGCAVGLELTGNSAIYSKLLISKPLYYPSHLKPDSGSVFWSLSLSF